MRLQAAVRMIYPPQCLTCDAPVTSDFGLCASCWRETPFVSGVICDCCGVPLPGGDVEEVAVCDDCLRTPRPWQRGRAALVYKDNARKLVLALKHGDRMDLARPASHWLHQAALPLLTPDTLIVPVPLHWLRLVKRRYNQAALLSAGVAILASLPACPDLLSRRRNTRSQEGRDLAGRFANVEDAFAVHPGRRWLLPGRTVLLVDDVMTSGATLTACSEALLVAGAKEVNILTLARVARDA